LSRRSGSSTALRLRIGSSRRRDLAWRALGVAAAALQGELVYLGYAFLALLLTPPLAWILWQLRRAALEGAVLVWDRGGWLLERDGTRSVVVLAACNARFAGAVYLDLREPPRGCRCGGWLFADCVEAREMRRLRVRLALAATGA